MVERLLHEGLNKTLADEDIEKANEFIARHPDSEVSRALQSIVKGYKGKTTESKARSAKEEKDAKAIYIEIANLPIDDQFKAFRSWSDEKKKLFRKYYNIDTKKGAEARKWQK